MSHDQSTADAPASGFHKFGFGKRVLRGIEEAGYQTPTPIQDGAIEPVLEGRDILGLAQTGTGKTAAFALPVLERLMTPSKSGRAPRVLVMAPTRELVSQIQNEFTQLGQFTRVTAIKVFGGVNQNPQVRALRDGPEVVVAAPGRLLDLINQGVIDLSGVEVLILDEADHMFDMGFLPDVRRILKALPKRRQNLLFSATMPKELRKLTKEVLHDPVVVELAHSAPVDTIAHELYPVHQTRKGDLLFNIISDKSFESAIIFTRTKHRAKRLAQQLSRRGNDATSLQGNMSQPQRERSMAGFRDGTFNIMVATDIAARGIDVANVSHVINFDVPGTPEAYLHRIGRTGRAKKEGRAYTFVTPEDFADVKAIERKLGLEIPRRKLEDFNIAKRKGEGTAELDFSRGPRQRPAGGGGGQRKVGTKGKGGSRPKASGAKGRSSGSSNSPGPSGSSGGSRGGKPFGSGVSGEASSRASNSNRPGGGRKPKASRGGRRRPS